MPAAGIGIVTPHENFAARKFDDRFVERLAVQLWERTIGDRKLKFNNEKKINVLISMFEVIWIYT